MSRLSGMKKDLSSESLTTVRLVPSQDTSLTVSLEPLVFSRVTTSAMAAVVREIAIPARRIDVMALAMRGLITQMGVSEIDLNANVNWSR